MAFRCKDNQTGRPRRSAEPALSPFARPDGTCLGRRPEEPPDEPVPKPFWEEMAADAAARRRSAPPGKFSVVVRFSNMSHAGGEPPPKV